MIPQHPHLRYQTAEQMGLPTLNNLVFLGTENGTLLWTPKLLEPFTLEILASSDQGSLSSVLKPRTVVCECKAESQCLYNQTSWVSNSSLEVSVRQRSRGGFPVEGKEVGIERMLSFSPFASGVCWERGSERSRYQSRVTNVRKYTKELSLMLVAQLNFYLPAPIQPGW